MKRMKLMKRVAIPCLIAAFLAGCAGTVGGARYPNAATPEARALFDAADALYRAKRFSEADQSFERLIAEFPYNQLTDESRFLRGEIAFARGNFGNALTFYRQAVSQIASPAVAPKSRFKAALSLFHLNRPQEALDELREIRRKETSAILRLRADSLGARASKAAGLSPNLSIAWHLFLLDDHPEAVGLKPVGIAPDELISEEDALSQVKRWMADKDVAASDVEALPLKEMRGKRSGGYATFKLATILHETGDSKSALKQLKSFIHAYPKHEYYGAARAMLGEMGGVVGAGAGAAVGVLLPLSGKYATHGESALHGIECAVGVYEPCTGPTGIKLIVKDSGSSPAEAQAAVDELAQVGVIGIVGPLLSANAVEGSQRAEELKIPTLSLSQRSGIAEIGEYVFRNSVSDSSEMATLADHAVNRLRSKRILILYPYGSKRSVEYKDLFASAARDLGAAEVEARGYSYSQVAEIGGGDELRGRGRVEFGQQMKEGKEGGERAAPDFSAAIAASDAVFMPDSPAMAAHILGSRDQQAPRRARVLGISMWGEMGRSGRIPPSLEGAVFVDSFFKDSSEGHIAGFVAHFREAYGVEPTLLEALAYDSMRLIAHAIVERGAASREALRGAMARTSAFPGVAGKTSMNAAGDAQRELTVLKISGGRIGPAD